MAMITNLIANESEKDIAGLESYPATPKTKKKSEIENPPPGRISNE